MGTLRKDSSKNNYTVTSSSSFIAGKFGKAAGGADIVMPNRVFNNIILKDFTIDCWVMFPKDKILNILLGWDGGGMLYSAIRLSLCQTTLAVFIEGDTGASHGDIKTYDHGWAITGFYHAALVRKGNRFLVFINGNKCLDFVSERCNSLDSNRQRNVVTWIENAYIDELRISNVARWTSNFTPPTKPYNL